MFTDRNFGRRTVACGWKLSNLSLNSCYCIIPIRSIAGSMDVSNCSTGTAFWRSSTPCPKKTTSVITVQRNFRRQFEVDPPILNLCKVEKNSDLLPNFWYIKVSNITSGAQRKIFEKGTIFFGHLVYTGVQPAHMLFSAPCVLWAKIDPPIFVVIYCFNWNPTVLCRIVGLSWIYA